MLTDRENLKNLVWMERLIYLPIKLGIAYAVYTYLEFGWFLIIAYVLFCLGEQSNRQFINAQEANIALNDLHKPPGAPQSAFDRHLELTELKDQLASLELRITDLEESIEE